MKRYQHMKIYTKTGDSGSTSLFGAGRVSKDNMRVQAYGEVDELNSLVGLARSISDSKTQALDDILSRIQDRLFVIGSMLATPQEAALYTTIPHLAKEDILFLEVAMDKLSAQMSHLHSFILPGGHQLAAQLHVARAVCRRVERSVVKLSRGAQVDPLIIMYINRLSDLLFEAARWVNHRQKIQEKQWKGR